MKKGVDYFSKTFPLNSRGIDECSEVLEEQLKERGIEVKNRIRIRFSFEESLLRMRDHYGEEEDFRLRINDRRGKCQVLIEKDGTIFNPLSKTQAELQDWSGSLLTAVGLSPLYGFYRDTNTLRVNLPHDGMNPALKLLIALAAGIATGCLLRANLAPDALVSFSDTVLVPFSDLWIRLLTLMSGPIFLLMIMTSIINMGTIEEEGGNSLRIVMRYFLISVVAALISLGVCRIVFSASLKTGVSSGVTFKDLLDALLSIVPSDMFTPLIGGETHQILFLAFAIGNVLYFSGSKTEMIKILVRQGNMVGLMLAEGVSNAAPFFAALLVGMEIINGTLKTFRGMWGVLALALLTSAAFVCGAFFHLAVIKNVRPKVLFEKLRPAFVTAILTGGIDKGYGEMEESCTKDLGIEKHFAIVSLPYGYILYTSINVIGTLMFTLYAATRYNVTISTGWLILAVCMAVILFVAAAPVPGLNLLAYIVIFAELGIPAAALTDAMIFDILFGIFAAAANQALLQMDLVLQADRIGLLDREVLRKEKA